MVERSLSVCLLVEKVNVENDNLKLRNIATNHPSPQTFFFSHNITITEFLLPLFKYNYIKKYQTDVNERYCDHWVANLL